MDYSFNLYNAMAPGGVCIPIIEMSPTLESFLLAPLPGLIPRFASLISPISPAIPTAAWGLPIFKKITAVRRRNARYTVYRQRFIGRRQFRSRNGNKTF